MKNKIRLLLIFTFLIIFSYTLLSNKYLGDVEYMNYAYNNYFSEYSLEFKNDDKLDQFIQSLINDKKDISISSVDLKNNIIKIASYNESFKPKIVKGRYFNTDDNNACIVCENGLYKIGDYYKIDSIEYKIIGLYKEMHLSSDNLVFVNLCDVDYKNSPIIKIDFNEDNLYKAASTNPNLTVVNNDYVSFNNYLPQRVIFIMIHILFCLSVLVIMSFYVEEKKEEIKLKYIFGFSYTKIYFDIFIKVFIYISLSWIIAFVFIRGTFSTVLYLLLAYGLCGMSLLPPLNQCIKEIKMEKTYEWIKDKFIKV